MDKLIISYLGIVLVGGTGVWTAADCLEINLRATSLSSQEFE